MKSATLNTPQVEVLNADELHLKTIGVYRVLREQLSVMLSETSRTPGYLEQNLLDENMGPEIRRIRW